MIDQLVTGLISFVLGGGLIKAWESWRKSKQDDQTFVVMQYKELAEQEHKTNQRYLERIAVLEKRLDDVQKELIEKVVENLHLKSELHECKTTDC